MKTVIATCGLLLHATMLMAGEPVRDAEILRGVEHAMSQDAELMIGRNVKATVNAGVVYLTGLVENLSQHNFAVQNAEKIRGVIGVEDELNIRYVKVSDDDVAKAVKRRVSGTGIVRSEKLAASCDQGVVTLTGDVADFSQVRLATELAGEVAGVTKVVNKLLIGGEKHRTDDEIRRDITASLWRNAYLHDLAIDVEVQTGTVTLEGTVGNPYEKRLAEREVEYVSHVHGIHNHLQVDATRDPGAAGDPADLTDEEILQHVIAEIQQDVRIMRMPIKVACVNHEVTLSGTVNVTYEKEIAERDAAETVGVQRVNNKIKIDRTVRPDDDLQTEISLNLGADALLHHQAITVNVVHGSATLSGIVNNVREYERAAKLASRTVGVREIVNNLDIEPRDVRADEEVAESISAWLAWNYATAPIAPLVQVSVENGIVTLKGELAYAWQKQTVGHVASYVNGVRKVENRLTVASSS